MMRYANLCSKKGICWRNGKPPPIHNNVYGLHRQKKVRIKPNNTRINALVLSVFFILELCKTNKGIGLVRHNLAMVGERIRREPWGETESWKEKGKVWKKLQKGRITCFMERLHGFDAEVNKNMVET